MADNPWNLSESALQIVDKRFSYWPWCLFVQVLADDVVCSHQLLPTPPAERLARVDDADTLRWFDDRLGAVRRIQADCTRWYESDFPRLFDLNDAQCHATGETSFEIPEDVPSDKIPVIIDVSRGLAAIYRQAAEWQRSVRYADVHSAFREAAYELSFLADSLISAVAAFPIAAGNLLKPLVDLAAGSLPQTAQLRFDTTIPATVRDAFREAYERVSNRALVEIEGGPPGPYWIVADNPWHLGQVALQIVDQHRDFWPGDLFAQVLIDEVSASKSLLYTPPVGTLCEVQSPETMEWAAGRLESLTQIFVDVGAWASSDFLGFFGCGNGDRPLAARVDVNFPQHASLKNVPTIVAISRRLCALYRQAIEWSHSVRNANVHPLFRAATYELSFYADSILRNTEGLGPAILMLMGLQRDRAQADVLAQTAEAIHLAPSAPAFDQFVRALKTAYERLQCGAASDDASPAPGKAGYLYILTNPSLSNMVKIGKTTRNPRDRINELSAATGIPTPFVLAFDAYVEDCDKAEAYVHARLEKDGYRVAKNREFFRIDLSTAIASVLEAQAMVSAPGQQAGKNFFATS
jgi:hypothetical protein